MLKIFFLQGERKGCVVYPNAKSGFSAHCYYPGKWPSSPRHGAELPGMPWNPKVRVRPVSLQAAKSLLCVSLSVLCFMCSPNSDDSHCPDYSRRSQSTRTRQVQGRWNPWASLGRNRSKCKQAVSHRATHTGRGGWSHIFAL